MTGLDKDIFRATRTLTTLLNDACNHWNYLCPYLEKLCVAANRALEGYQKDYPNDVATIIAEDRKTKANDMAAMRKTLEEMAADLEDLASRDAIRAPAYSSIFSIYAEKCRKALGAPPRNCDRYSHDEALQVWASEKGNERNGCFDEWLYEIAKEGGAK